MKSVRWFTVAAFILILVSHSFAQSRNQVFIGARPLALGETFVAIADDGNALYWNPAGLPLLENYGIGWMHANLYNTGARSNYLSFFLPFTEQLAFGADWFNIGFDDEEIEFLDNKFNLALAYKFSDRLSFGLNLKHARFDANYLDLQGGILFDANARGFGGDVGVLYTPSTRLRLGAMLYDLTNTQLKHSRSGRREVIQSRNLRYGAAYWLRQNWLVAADVDDRLHLGSEFKPLSFVTLRAGWQKDRHTDEGPTYAGGAGLEFKLLRQTLRLDYAYTMPPALPDMNVFSAAILFDLFSPRLKIEKIDIAPVYASLYKRHSQTSIGTAVIKYKGKERLDYKISVAIPPYTRAKPKEFFIEPDTTAKARYGNNRPDPAVTETVEPVPLYALFTDSILAVEGNTPMSAEVTVSYRVNRRSRTVHESRAFKLFSRNKLNWGQGVEQVAAFIDPEDSDVEAAVNDFLARVPAEILMSPNLNRAQKLFEGLGLAAITYKEDPYQSYAGVDNVLYPYQLLKENKQGDCDDLTVLYAALLENCNIPVALISTSDHIFLMFDTGIPERQQEKLWLPPSMYLIDSGNVWIPIEITEVGKSFDAAWEQGVRNFQTYAAAGDTEIVKVRDAWAKYEAVKYPSRLKHKTPPLPYAAPGNFARQIRQKQEDYKNGLQQQLAQDPLEVRQRLARSHAMNGEYTEAQKYLREVLAVDAKNFMAYNNLGNVYFLQGQLDSAAANYAKALPWAKTADDSLGIRLNLGALLHVEDDDSLAAAIISEALRHGNDLARVERLLGLKFDKLDSTKAGAEKFQVLSAFNMKNLAKMASDTKGKKKEKKPPKKDKTRPAIQKGNRPAAEIENVFFWAR
ncbi:MAG: hypothetical protein ALAOOOJD_00088 [bacterium]|nr:hypothetical protein [bacterium]